MTQGRHRHEKGPAIAGPFFDQLSRKLRSLRLRLGCFSLRSALASIWRMRSRVTENCWPTSSSVWSVFMPMPKRMRSTRSSRGVREASTRVVVSRRFAWIAASSGRIAFLSSMKSPRWLSSSSPIGRLEARSAPWRSSAPCAPFRAACAAFRPVLPASARGRSRAASGARCGPAC